MSYGLRIFNEWQKYILQISAFISRGFISVSLLL